MAIDRQASAPDLPEDWQHSGRQTYRREGDIIVSRWVGACTIAELEPFLVFAEKVLAQQTHPFLLVNNTQALPGLPEVRRRVVTWARAHSFQGGVVIFGASLPTRAIGILMLNAISLLKGIDLNKRITYTRVESEARAWVERRRAVLRSMPQSSDPARRSPAPPGI